jgi:hypothetical protein
VTPRSSGRRAARTCTCCPRTRASRPLRPPPRGRPGSSAGTARATSCSRAVRSGRRRRHPRRLAGRPRSCRRPPPAARHRQGRPPCRRVSPPAPAVHGQRARPRPRSRCRPRPPVRRDRSRRPQHEPTATARAYAHTPARYTHDKAFQTRVQTSVALCQRPQGEQWTAGCSFPCERERQPLSSHGKATLSSVAMVVGSSRLLLRPNQSGHHRVRVLG